MQLSGQNAIEFDGDKPPRPPGQQGSQSSAPSSDFEHGALGEIAKGFGNAYGGCGVDEKMLTQFWRSRRRTRSRYFRHIDPLSFGRLHWKFTPRIFVCRSDAQ